MKKIISFEDIKEKSIPQGLDGAINIAFPGCSEVKKDGLIGLPFGTVEIDGKGWDWILKADHYLFIEAC